jgi:hypothetical protein
MNILEQLEDMVPEVAERIVEAVVADACPPVGLAVEIANQLYGDEHERV